MNKTLIIACEGNYINALKEIQKKIQAGELNGKKAGRRSSYFFEICNDSISTYKGGSDSYIIMINRDVKLETTNFNKAFKEYMKLRQSLNSGSTLELFGKGRRLMVKFK